MSTKIKGRLVRPDGSPTGIRHVLLRNKNVRVAIDGDIITGESAQVPVSENGDIEFEAEPGPAVLVVWVEPGKHSRSHLVPLWIPEEDSTLEEAFNLGRIHETETGESVTELVYKTVEVAVAGFEDRILSEVNELIAEAVDGDIVVDLTGYATESWVNGQIEIISLTPGPQGDRGPRGKDGEDGQDGKDAVPLTVENTNLDIDGNTVISFSDGSTITVSKGKDGQDGKDGDDAAPLTVENTTLDIDGNTIISFSDGSEVTVFKGEDGKDGDNAAPLTVEGTTLDSEGNTLVTFSDGNEITVAKGKDGQDGISPHIDQTTGNWHLGDTDTGVKAQGPQGDPGPPGIVDPDDIRGTVVDILNLDPGTLYIDGSSAVNSRDQLRAALDYRGLGYLYIEEIPFEIKLLGVTNLNSLFDGMRELRKAPLLNTSGVSLMGNMFSNCSSLTEIPSFDTSSVRAMNSMFNNCSSLTEIPDLDTSSATAMGYMFRGCSSLSFVPDMYPILCTSFGSMFRECSQLTDGNVRIFDAPSDRSTSNMILDSGLTEEPFYESE